MGDAASNPQPGRIPGMAAGSVGQGCSAAPRDASSAAGSEQSCFAAPQNATLTAGRASSRHSTPKTPPLQTGWGRATLQHPKMPFPTGCCNFPSTPYQSGSVPPCLTGKPRHGVRSLPRGKGADGQHPALGSRVRMVWPTLGCHPVTGQPLVRDVFAVGAVQCTPAGRGGRCRVSSRRA